MTASELDVLKTLIPVDASIPTGPSTMSRQHQLDHPLASQWCIEIGGAAEKSLLGTNTVEICYTLLFVELAHVDWPSVCVNRS
jgi:hypothetical protein